MKFIVKNIRNGSCRLGVITEMGCQKTQTIDTPMCMLYTRGGSVPSLTADMVKKIKGTPVIREVHCNWVNKNCEAIAEYNQGIAKFTALQDYMVYCSVQDSAVETPTGYNSKSATAVWGVGGKMMIDVEQLIKVQEAIRPTIYQALSDPDTNKESANKRAGKSVDRTLNYLDKILELHKNSEKLSDVCVFGSVVGGYSLEERLRSARETATRSVDGFVLEGFHCGGANTKNFELNTIEDLCKKTLECLPPDKPRIMHSPWQPDQVLYAVELGIDIFDSSYPYLVTERGAALVFSFDYRGNPEDMNGKQELKCYDITLSDKRFVDDFGPILEDCECYTCQNFTRAYINHLLNTKELQAMVLLNIHNFQHYFDFFQTIRRSLEEDEFCSLKTLILQQMPQKDVIEKDQ